LVGAAAIVAAATLWFVIDDQAHAKIAEQRRRDIEARGQFALITDRLQDRVAPLIGEADRPVHFDDLSPADQLGALKSLDAALAPYPPGFIKRFIDKVVLASDIRFWGGTRIGGCFFDRGIAIAYGGDGSDTIDPVNRDTFHHELSSHVRIVSQIDDARWAGFNAPGTGYLSEADYRKLIADGQHKGGDAALYEAGFVRPYGRSDIDDDWNTFAEQVFGHAQDFANLIRPYPRLRGKTGMMLDTYQALEPRFAGYFDSTGLRAAVSGS
jgi:hypothetical protein